MKLLQGDCLIRLGELEDNSIDAIVTDPPYGLSFMGKKWDYDVPKMEVWQECLRVLKPGGYLLSFAGTRTQHRMAVNIEDAGFEIRDMIAWVYGSGFPKSLNIGKAVDKLQGNEREIVGKTQGQGAPVHNGNFKTGEQDITKGTSEYEGWGTALKPALEPITVARKPLGEKTVAENCLKWGVGGINIDGCRVDGKTEIHSNGKRSMYGGNSLLESKTHNDKTEVKDYGRFPANLIHDGSDEVVGLFPNSKSAGEYKKDKLNTFIPDEAMFPLGYQTNAYAGESGSASRFFYCAKASKRERNMGCEGLKTYTQVEMSAQEKTLTRVRDNGTVGENPYLGKTADAQNIHPTVKPLALMEYLIKLVSREGQVVLDPFMGSGTTGMACKKLNRDFVGIEMMEEYMEIAKCRIEAVKQEEQLRI